MKLRLRIGLTVAVVLVGLVITLSVTTWALSLRNLQGLEAQNAQNDVKRVLHALDSSLDNMKAVLIDWSHWDDTYEFAADGNEAYVEENLGAYFFETFDTDALAIFDSKGVLLYGEHYEVETEEVAPLSEEVINFLRNDLLEKAVREVKVGFMALPGGYALIATGPVLNNEGEGPIRGAMMMVRYLNEARAQAYSEAVLASVSFVPLSETSSAQGLEQTTFEGHNHNHEHRIYAQSLDNTVAGFTTLNDLSGQPTLTLRVANARVLYQQSLLSVRYLILSVVIASVTFSLLALALVERLVLSRLTFLSRTVGTIAKSGNVAERITLIGADELARLASDINGMLASLERTFEALRTSEERYALAAEGVNDGMWDWDMVTREMVLSNRCAALLGLDREEIDFELWMSLAHPDDFDRVHKQLLAHVKGETPYFETELRMKHQEGHFRWMLARGVAVRGQDGRAQRMAGSLTDITQRGVFDALTGLPNRLLLTERLEHALCKSQENAAYRCAALFMDLNRFKVINDSLGHKVGDLLLVEIAKRLQACVDSGDLVARLGGDEFVILLEDVEDVDALLGNIEAELSRAFELDGHTVHTGASIGVVTPLQGYDDAEDVLENADIAMYRAKELGHAHLHFDDAIYEQATARQRTETELREALSRGEFRLVYQPILSLETGELVSVEALLRWQHPTRGLVPPNDFIPVAEESGLIVPIGAWVLREACRDLSAADLPRTVSVSVNLSAKQLVQPDIVGEVGAILSEVGLRAQQLKLEVTESAVIENRDLATAHLMGLRSLGVQVVMDDFGTGYSSLSYLHSLPIQLLKIDRSFVSQMGEDDTRLEIVRAILSLAQSLNLEVVAEGIETNAQLEMLRDLGCTYAQGYFFAKPSPLEDVLAHYVPLAQEAA